MQGVRTRGQAVALDAVTAMIRGRAPHAVLLVGPAGVGKTTLALDLAAGLLCTAAEVSERPCGTCRACRLVASGGHPDVHRLGPDGPGRQVVIGGPGSRVRGIRDVIGDLALMPVEGGARIAIVESAHRMNEDAQAALLKTLEEPPSGVTIILCADAEETLLPTIRSRCARLRLGPVGPRDIEAILDEHGVGDPALAARLARTSGGRPGLALAWAADPDAVRGRDEIARTLLDLTAARPSERLAALRGMTATAIGIAGVADRGSEATADTTTATDPSSAATDPDAATTTAAARIPAVDRRRAADAVIAIWTDVARDLLLVRLGLTTTLRDHRLLEESTTTAEALDGPALVAFLDRLGRAGVLLAGNVSPELILDDLALAWPHRGSRAA